jgi:hypothetical protein
MVDSEEIDCFRPLYSAIHFPMKSGLFKCREPLSQMPIRYQKQETVQHIAAALGKRAAHNGRDTHLNSPGAIANCGTGGINTTNTGLSSGADLGSGGVEQSHLSKRFWGQERQ